MTRLFRFFSFSLFMLLAVSCFEACVPASSGKGATAQEEVALTAMQWQDTVVRLGDIHAGTTYPLTFTFRNTGAHPLLMQRLESTCGCTLINESSHKPVVPGDTGRIEAQLKITEPVGYIERKIYLITNTPIQFYVLRIQATVRE